MSFHEILIAVMAAFAVLGAIDRILGNRFGLGQEFENGILAMGSLALAMVGIVSLAPVLAAILRPVVVPVFRLLGADPAIFAGLRHGRRRSGPADDRRPSGGIAGRRDYRLHAGGDHCVYHSRCHGNFRRIRPPGDGQGNSDP